MRKTVTLVLGGAFLLVLSGAAAAQTPGFKVVVHRDNPVQALPKGKIAFMFMKMTTKWDHGAAVSPIDRESRDPVRAAFSREVHGRDVEAVQTAWQRAIFAGRGEPPPEAESDEAVIAHVAGHAGGIGYVSAGAATEKVKVISVLK